MELDYLDVSWTFTDLVTLGRFLGSVPLFPTLDLSRLSMDSKLRKPNFLYNYSREITLGNTLLAENKIICFRPVETKREFMALSQRISVNVQLSSLGKKRDQGFISCLSIRRTSSWAWLLTAAKHNDPK